MRAERAEVHGSGQARVACLLRARALPLAGGSGLLARCFLLWRQQRAAASLCTTPAGVLGQQLGRVGFVDHQTVVVKQLFTGCDVAQRTNEDPPFVHFRLAVGRAAVVDPARGVAAELGVDHMVFVDVKVEGVVGVAGVVRVTAQRFVPADHLAHVLDQRLALGQIRHRIHALAVHARTPGLDAAPARGKRGGGGARRRRAGAFFHEGKLW